MNWDNVTETNKDYLETNASILDKNSDKSLDKNAWDGRQFLVGGEAGLIFKSKAGVKWTKYKSNVDGYVYNICYNGKIYVGVQNTAPNDETFDASSLVNNIKLCYSSDGVKWKVYNVDKDINCFTKILWNGSKFIAFYHKVTNFDDDDYSAKNSSVDSYLAYSKDGKAWSKKLVGEDISINCVEYNGKQFAALASNPAVDESKVFMSNNGTSWQQFACNVKYQRDENIYGKFIKWVNGRFVCIGSNNEILISNNGIKWTCSGEISDGALNAIDGNKNILVIAGDDTTMFYSK